MKYRKITRFEDCTIWYIVQNRYEYLPFWFTVTYCILEEDARNYIEREKNNHYKAKNFKSTIIEVE